MREVLSNTVKAGRLLCLLGWFYAACCVVVLVAIVIPTMHKGISIPKVVWLGIGGIILVAAAYLMVGRAVMNYRWRKGGLILTVLSLPEFPPGTIIGGFLLYYLARGWNEVPGSPALPIPSSANAS